MHSLLAFAPCFLSLESSSYFFLRPHAFYSIMESPCLFPGTWSSDYASLSLVSLIIPLLLVYVQVFQLKKKKKNLFLDPMTTFNCILTSFVLLTAKFFEDISGENIHRVHQNLTLLFPRKQKPLLYIFLLGNLIYSYGFSCPPCAADF